MKYPARKQQLLDDALEVATLIFDTLRLSDALYFNDLWDLCESHGCRPYICPAAIEKKWGYWMSNGEVTDFSDGGIIILSDNMTFAQSCSVMAHELAHRILYSPRFGDWLDTKRTHRQYDPHDWQESVARAVERLFLEAGGTGLLPPRY